jgi:hypothetical protein
LAVFVGCVRAETCPGYQICDTELNYWEWTAVVDAELANEAAGMRPPGGNPTWNERWVGSIRATEATQENAEKYIRYLETKRLELGLPPIQI